MLFNYKTHKFIYNISIYYSINIYYIIKMLKKPLHYPRLDTILNVESVIRNAKEPLSKNEIDRRLIKQIMRPTLNVIFDYLEKSGKIAILKEGIIWIYKEDISRKLKNKLDKGVVVM
jgi:hypothetical protein